MNISEIDYSRKWYVMIAVSMGTLLATIDGSIVNVALPTLVRELDTDFATVQWVVLGYLLTLAVLMLSVGRFADMVGKKRIYTIGLILFTFGSLLCGLAPSVYFLIAFRVLQALGATMMMALGVAIVTEAFPPQERGKALGVSGTMVSIGIAVGPTLGGLILDAFSWHWIFFVNLPIGVIGVILVSKFVPNIKPKGNQSFDFWGAAAMFLSLLSLLFALTIGQNEGFLDWRPLALFVGFVVFLAAFIMIEKRVKQPMIDLSMFDNLLFSINLVTGFLTFVAFAGTIILFPFFLENIMAYNTKQVGLLLAVIPALMGVTAPISGTLSDKLGSRKITLIGLGILLVGYLALVTINEDKSMLALVLYLLPLGIGMGVFQSPNNSAIMGAAPQDKLGLVSGMLSLTRTLGQSTGIAVDGAIWAALTISYALPEVVTSTTDAPSFAQVSALQDTFMVISGMIFAALLLAVLGVVKENKQKAAQAS